MFWVLNPDSSFEYPQHMFCMRNKKKKIQLRTLTRGPAVKMNKYFSLKNVVIFIFHCGINNHISVLFTPKVSNLLSAENSKYCDIFLDFPGK